MLGIPLLKYKLLSFALSSFYAGVAGGMWAYFFRVVTPESFPLIYSVFFLAAVIVGGMGTILGAILGAIFMTMVPGILEDRGVLYDLYSECDSTAVADSDSCFRLADYRGSCCSSRRALPKSGAVCGASFIYGPFKK